MLDIVHWVFIWNSIGNWNLSRTSRPTKGSSIGLTHFELLESFNRPSSCPFRTPAGFSGFDGGSSGGVKFVADETNAPTDLHKIKEVYEAEN